MRTKILKEIIDNSHKVNINDENEMVVNSKFIIDLIMDEWEKELKELKKLTNK